MRQAKEEERMRQAKEEERIRVGGRIKKTRDDQMAED